MGDDWNVFAQTKWSTNVFDQPGEHEIQLRVSDGELWGTNRITIEILLPEDILARVISFTEERPDHEPIASEFLALIRDALREFEDANYLCGAELLWQALELTGEDNEQRVVSDKGANVTIIGALYTLFFVIEEGLRP